MTLYIGASETSALVHELREQGWQIGVDFDFAYHPERYDGFTQGHPRHTEFFWHNPAGASWFALKYKKS